jgi:hypothetical protein
MEKVNELGYNGAHSEINRSDVGQRDNEINLWNKKMSLIKLLGEFVHYIQKYDYKPYNKYILAYEEIKEKESEITFQELTKILKNKN